jgi:hypothetical protein
MNKDLCKLQTQRARELAERADPFIRKRLLDLADRYEAQVGNPSRASKLIERPLPIPGVAPVSGYEKSGEAPPRGKFDGLLK